MTPKIAIAAVGLSCWLLAGIGLDQGSNYTVCAESCPYRSVQAAINEAAEGATIQIGPGLYRENLEIRKSLRLVGAGQNQVIIQGNDEKKAFINVSSEISIQFHLQGVTLGDPSRPTEPSSPSPGIGLQILGPIQTVLRQVTIGGLGVGIYADEGSQRLPPQIILEEVYLVRNGVGLLFLKSPGLVVIRSKIEENLFGIFGGGPIFLYSSWVQKNQLVGLHLDILSAPGPQPLGQIDNDEIVQNGIGIYLEALFPLAAGSWIEMSKNHINQNRQYGIVVRDPACPTASGQPSSSPPTKSAEIRFFGTNNEFQSNIKGNVCPSDYPLPPGFVKP